MLKPRKREGIKTFYFTTNTFSIRVAQYKANPKASISDVFQRSVQDMAHDCGFFYALQKTRSRSHRLDIRRFAEVLQRISQKFGSLGNYM